MGSKAATGFTSLKSFISFKLARAGCKGQGLVYPGTARATRLVYSLLNGRTGYNFTKVLREFHKNSPITYFLQDF